jgi:hypothetical protein
LEARKKLPMSSVDRMSVEDLSETADLLADVEGRQDQTALSSLSSVT